MAEKTAALDKLSDEEIQQYLVDRKLKQAETLKEKRAGLLAQVAELDKEISLLDSSFQPTKTSRGGKGGTRPGRKITDALREAGKPLTVQEIASAKELFAGVVKDYIEGHKDAYAESGGKYTLKK